MIRRLIVNMLNRVIDWIGIPPVEDLTYRPVDESDEGTRSTNYPDHWFETKKAMDNAIFDDKVRRLAPNDLPEDSHEIDIPSK